MTRVKTEITFKNSPIKNEEEFFKLMFPRSTVLSENAYRLFQKALEHKLPKNSYRTLQEDGFTINIMQFYSIIGKLRLLGMIKLVDSDYVISEDFIKHLSHISNYYKTLIVDVRQ